MLTKSSNVECWLDLSVLNHQCCLFCSILHSFPSSSFFFTWVSFAKKTRSNQSLSCNAWQWLVNLRPSISIRVRTIAFRKKEISKDYHETEKRNINQANFIALGCLKDRSNLAELKFKIIWAKAKKQALKPSRNTGKLNLNFSLK